VYLLTREQKFVYGEAGAAICKQKLWLKETAPDLSEWGEQVHLLKFDETLQQGTAG